MSAAAMKTTTVTTPIQNKPFTALRIQMYTFIVNSGFIFKHLLNVLEKYSSICIFHLQPSNTQAPTVTVKAVIPEKTVVADIPVHVNVYTSTVDVHVSERAEHTYAQPVAGCGWKSNTEHLQFTVAMSKLYDWLNDARSKITTSDQLQFVFYCWGERNLLQMYSVAVIQIPIVNKTLKQNAKRAALFHSMSGLSSSSPSFEKKPPLEEIKGGMGPVTEPFKVDLTMYDYNSMVLHPGHFHQLIHKWHEGLIDENEEELDEKHFHVPKKGKKGPKTIDSGDDEDNDEDMEDEAEAAEGEDVVEDEETTSCKDSISANKVPPEVNANTAVRAQKRKWNQETNVKPLFVGIKKPKPTRNKTKPKKSNKAKSRKQQLQQSSSKQQREPRSIVFHSRPFVDRFLFIPSTPPKESDVVLNVSTSEFHSICRDLALGGNFLSMMRSDKAFYMSTSGEPGTVVFEFLENPFLDEKPRVPSVFNGLSTSCLAQDTVVDSLDPVLAGLGVPQWFHDLVVPPSFEFCNTTSWSHLPTCIERLKRIRSLEVVENDVPCSTDDTKDKSLLPLGRSIFVSNEQMSNNNSIPSLVKQEESTNHCDTVVVSPSSTHTSRHQTKPMATSTNFQSCYSLTLHKSLTLPQSQPESINTSNPQLSTQAKETHFLLRLLKMCTKEFSSKSLSSFPYVQLRFTAGRFLVLSLSEPFTNHGMSIHVYISPVS